MTMIGPIVPTGGLNLKASNFTVPQNQLTTLTDAFVTAGNIKNRGAVTKLNANATGVTYMQGISFYNDPAQVLTANQPLLVVVAGDNSASAKAYTGVPNTTYTTLTLADKTGTATFSFHNGDIYTFDALGSVFAAAGGSVHSFSPAQLGVYTGSFAALSGSPPNSDLVKVVNNFMFLGGQFGSSTTVSRVNWSNVEDPTTWGATNYVDFRFQDGDTLSALWSIGEDLLIFKTRSFGRLSTTTTSISGAVTLAPLTTISMNVGCAGPMCVDSLPDGRIVFLDINNHLNIYDGSSIMDVSDQKFPGPNVQPNLDQSQNGLQGGRFNQFIKVYPTKNQVLVNFLDTNSAANYYIYDYRENHWHQEKLSKLGASQTRLTCATFAPSVPTSSAVGQGGYLLAGSSAGNIWILDGSAGPTDIDGTSIQPIWTYSVVFSGEFADFIPRSILLPFTLQSGASLTVTLGFDGTLNGSASTVITGSTQARQIVDVGNLMATMRPISLQVQVQVTAGKTFTAFPIWISDEIIT